MDKKIYISDWLELKPYKKQTKTDGFYLRICNEVKKAIVTNEQSFYLLASLESREIDFLSCFLTSYFEDLISGTNIWNSFVRTHKRLYGKQLPFYILDEYYEEEVNPQDISFLIWYFLNTFYEDLFTSPFSDYITDTAFSVMEVFDNTWEYAPENKHLKDFYQIDENEKDFYVARSLIDRILYKTYLFYPDTNLTLRENEDEIIQKGKDDNETIMLLNENRDQILHKAHTRLLALTGKEWAAEILNENKLKEEFLQISNKIQGFFLYKGQDNINVFFEHIASGKQFNITKESFEHAHQLDKVDTIVFLGIVRWRNEWWFSGISFSQPFNADLILSEKSSFQSRAEVNFLDHQTQDTSDYLSKQLSAFLEYNHGSQIAFMPSDKIDDFMKEFMDFFNSSLKLTDKEIEKAKQNTREDGFFPEKDKSENWSEASETGLVFFNPKSGLEIAFNVNSAFPMSSNPYFKEEESQDNIYFLLFDDSFSTELVLYCIDNFKTKLPFFKEGVGKKLLEDIDFLLRFWKKSNYFAKPSITYIGANDKTS